MNRRYHSLTEDEAKEIRHDLRNAVMSIRGYVDFYEDFFHDTFNAMLEAGDERCKGSEELLTQLREMNGSFDRVKMMTNEIHRILKNWKRKEKGGNELLKNRNSG